jgi:hypothetical protein
VSLCLLSDSRTCSPGPLIAALTLRCVTNRVVFDDGNVSERFDHCVVLSPLGLGKLSSDKGEPLESLFFFLISFFAAKAIEPCLYARTENDASAHVEHLYGV